jgi:hypothetical protein
MGKDLLFTLDKTLKEFNIPNGKQLVIRSDNGSQMTSHVFMDHVDNFDEDQVARDIIRAGAEASLQKPFTKKDLSGKIRTCLNQ